MCFFFWFCKKNGVILINTMRTKILYYSRTGNIKKFLDKLKYDNIQQIEQGLIVEEPFVLLVSTIKFGEVPIEYKRFLRDNPKGMIGVSGSGNRNWGSNFAIATDKVAKKFNVPIINKFELSGNKHDVKNFINGVERLEENGY